MKKLKKKSKRKQRHLPFNGGVFYTMKKTFLEIKEADQLVAQLYAKNPNLRDSKFGYNWKRVLDKNYKPTNNDLNDKIEDAKIDCCLTNEKTKEILYDEKGGYKFSKEGLKDLREIHKKLVKEYDLKEVEIIPFIVKKADLPELTEEEISILKGLIV